MTGRLLSPPRHPRPAHTHATLSLSGGKRLAAIVTIVVAPLVEELFFRGAGYAALRFRIGPLASALLTATFFGALHFKPWLSSPWPS